MNRRIYVASSWRNKKYPLVLDALRREGYQVYDFRNPEPGNEGFNWRTIDPDWQRWSLAESICALHSPEAQKGFAFDKAALDWCNTLVLVQPCGKSAHLEAGYAAGQGKQCFALLDREGFETELMYLLLDSICASMPDLLDALQMAPLRCDFFARASDYAHRPNDPVRK